MQACWCLSGLNPQREMDFWGAAGAPPVPCGEVLPSGLRCSAEGGWKPAPAGGSRLHCQGYEPFGVNALKPKTSVLRRSG